MTHNSRLVALAAGTAMIALQTAPAVAEGVTAGTPITNTATVDYRVGGVDQTDVVATDTFDVDRKVNFVVTRVSDPTTTVSPGQQDAVIAFDVANLSNDTIDLVLSASQLGSDAFDADNVTIFVDDGNGTFDGGDTATTLIDQIAEDATVRVFVVSDIALSRANGDNAALRLSATAHDGLTAGVQGAVLTTTPGADTDGVETVLADGAGVEDSTNDGVFTAEGSYTVFAATLTVTKASRVLSDGISATDPKAIPGALIEYCIVVGNGSSSATATNVIVTDVLPADLTFDGTFRIRVNGTIDGTGNCLDDGVPGGTFTGGTVSAPVSDVSAGQTRTAYFRATIN
jgi:uncharacterized repeat protein (TIGR01451 family)